MTAHIFGSIAKKVESDSALAFERFKSSGIQANIGWPP